LGLSETVVFLLLSAGLLILSVVLAIACHFVTERRQEPPIHETSTTSEDSKGEEKAFQVAILRESLRYERDVAYNSASRAIGASFMTVGATLGVAVLFAGKELPILSQVWLVVALIYILVGLAMLVDSEYKMRKFESSAEEALQTILKTKTESKEQ
jgi:Flp pilus assembly protein TadB